jgi:hypothetical protein
VTAHPTEALIFRSAARTGGVQLLDEVEALRGNHERFLSLVTVLNAGFERGAVVTRLEKRREQFVEVPYEVYAPRVLAGIAGLRETLEDRVLSLFMQRRRQTERVERLTVATDAEAQALRDRCALGCLTHIRAVLTAYEKAPWLLEQQGIDDRAVDLWSPLIALGMVADGEDGGDRTRDLLDAARELATERAADDGTGFTARLVEELEAVRATLGERHTAGGLLGALRARPGWDWLKTTKRLGTLLTPLGITRRQVRAGSRRYWCYVLDRHRLADLQARYGGGTDGGEDPARALHSSTGGSGSGDVRDNPHE